MTGILSWAEVVPFLFFLSDLPAKRAFRQSSLHERGKPQLSNLGVPWSCMGYPISREGVATRVALVVLAVVLKASLLPETHESSKFFDATLYV